MIRTRCIFPKTLSLNLNYIDQKSYNNKQKPKTNPYSGTVLLPKTNFPLRLSGHKLIERDSVTNNISTCDELYQWQRSPNRKNSEGEYVLHDGPPYANGPLHMGHAINKVLKDIVVRSKLKQGFKVDYKPGWDCHGLPIELKSVTENKSAGQKSPLEIRQTARKFATDTIVKQLNVFKSWGILADWKNPYKTFDKSYIKNQLMQFYKLFERGLIYRDLKPVYWSPESRTALAEAELQYNEKHVSNTVILKFRINNFPRRNYLAEHATVFALVWTTTPWTLPSNQAIAFNSALNYSLIQVNSNEFYILATDLLEGLKHRLKLDGYSLMETFEGSTLGGLSYTNPLSGAAMPFLAADHVTVSKGTGLVHTAPAHGFDDYLLALKYKIPIINLVDNDGRYTQEAGAILNQLPVLTAGNAKVVELLNANILTNETLVHSYPYDWRTNTPVILRASKQWFLNTDLVKESAAKCLTDVKIWPAVNSDIYRKTLMDQLLRRPYWCISRQRKWGVPIPVFYNKLSGLPILNKQILSRLNELLDSKGSLDFWFEMSPKEMLDKLDLGVALEDVERGEDILDIWFDSGISWSSVLEGPQVADMYLEGLDQFTGWFQSSLITSVCLRRIAPYKILYVHGHALDDRGEKMSKSKGNVIDPATVIRGNGVDTLRWWVACHASRDSAALVSDRVIQGSADQVHKLRTVLRFIVGVLMDYDNVQSNIRANLHVLDKYMLHLLWEYNEHVQSCIEECNFSKVCSTTINLITNHISALYFSAIKDRLYCDEAKSLNRVTAQYTLFSILQVLLKNTAAILPHLGEEVYIHLPKQLKNTDAKSYFQMELRGIHEELLNWENGETNKLMQLILDIKTKINKNTKEDPTKLDIKLYISTGYEQEVKQHFGSVQNAESQLELLFQVANVSLQSVANLADFCLETQRTTKYSCRRCRRFIIASKDDHLCSRCNNIVLNNSVYIEKIKQLS